MPLAASLVSGTFAQSTPEPTLPSINRLTTSTTGIALAQANLPEVRVDATRDTPLNTAVPASIAGRLGLTARETPATVDVLDQATLRARGYRSVSEAAEGSAGVTAGDFPAEPANFSMRGFANSQLNSLYNGIKIGPPNMTSRVMDTGNLERIEILKGPGSLMSGEGAAGGAINFVTKRPHRGAIENEVYASFGSFGNTRLNFGSGGSTSIEGLDYRFDLNRSGGGGFIDDTASERWHLSAGLDYHVSPSLKLWAAFESKQDRSSPYWGTPLVPTAFAGANAENGIVAGSYVSNYNATNLGQVTIDQRSLSTNYNVTDNRNTAQEHFLRGGFDLRLASNLVLRNHAYYYTAKREWFNNEVIAFNTGTNRLDRERFYVAHDQTLLGNKAELQWDTSLAGMPNRLVGAIEISHLDFDRPGAANFPADAITVADPVRGTYGLLTTQKQTATIRNGVLALENRLKLAPALSFVAGLRHELIELDRTSTNAAGANRAGFPFSTRFRPTTGRAGLTWEPIAGLMLYGQYATAADVAANNIFLLGGTQPLELSRTRTYETGLKQLFWANKAEWTFSVYDIARSNVYAAQGGRALAQAGSLVSQGAELAMALRLTRQWNLWANAAYTRARYKNYTFATGSFSGNTPPNVPKAVYNAGATYRFGTSMPIEAGVSARHVGDRFHSDANTVTLLAYTTVDAHTAVDLGKTRLTLRVRNLANRRYAIWSDPFYPDQILLGAPRSVELSAAIRF